jgi:ABC transporter substrate binding protein
VSYSPAQGADKREFAKNWQQAIIDNLLSSNSDVGRVLANLLVALGVDQLLVAGGLRGATAALGLNYYDLGRQTGKIVVRILNGEAPGQIAPQTSTSFELHLNPAAAQRQGITLPEALVESAKVVVR